MLLRVLTGLAFVLVLASVTMAGVAAFTDAYAGYEREFQIASFACGAAGLLIWGGLLARQSTRRSQHKVYSAAPSAGGRFGVRFDAESGRGVMSRVPTSGRPLRRH
jgi:hypothetical protein